MEQPTSNVEIFNRICLYLLSELYDSFPVPINIDADRQALYAIPESLDSEGALNVMDIANETLDFLCQEGFVSKSGSEFKNVRLTMKGLAILGVPVSLESKEHEKPLIDNIKSILGKGVEKSATKVVQSVISEVFKLAIS